MFLLHIAKTILKFILMTREDLFPTPLWFTVLNTVPDMLLEQIRKYCIGSVSEENSRIISNRGGYQSKDFYLHEVTHTPMHELFVAIQPFVDHCTNDYGIPKNLKIDNIWININRFGNTNTSHTHPKSILSGVFYVDAEPLSGGIMFERPNTTEAFLLNSLISDTKFLTWETVAYVPETKKLLIFPSWLKHSVSPNMSGKERISIAFNVGCNRFSYEN